MSPFAPHRSNSRAKSHTIPLFCTILYHDGPRNPGISRETVDGNRLDNDQFKASSPISRAA
jgi:hypothetical protein